MVPSRLRGPSDLLKLLRREGVAGELVKFSGSVKTVADAVKASGVPPSDIVKTLVVICDGEPVCVIIPGDRRLDSAKVRRALGARDVRLAKPSEVKALTGYAVGGVPPVGHGLKTIVDVRVLERPLVVGGGGDNKHLLRIAPAEIARATGAEILDVSRS